MIGREAAATGRTAPPTIAMQSSPDVAATGAVERSRVSEKMVGNMIELKTPMASAAVAATGPPLAVTTRHSTSAAVAETASTRCAGARISTTLPTIRPTIAPPQ